MATKSRRYRLVKRKRTSKGRVLFVLVAIFAIASAVLLFWPVEPPAAARRTAAVTNTPPVFTPASPASKPVETTNALPSAAKPVEPPKPADPPKQAAPPVPKPETTNAPAAELPPAEKKPLRPDIYPRPVQNVVEAQIALARQGISSGPIDGLMGSQTRSAIRAFQTEQALPATGELDDFTKELLLLSFAPFTNWVVSSNDLARVQPVSPTWLGKSQQSALDYESILELVAEKSLTHPNYLRRLNPSVNWTNVEPGVVLKVPDAAMPEVRAAAAFIRIYLSERLLQVFDVSSNLVAHFPCSIAQRVEKRPEGELHIVAVAPDPNYTFDPKVFPESEEARTIGRKLILPPGPNNPVGLAWISLDKPGYGIHGTPQPEQVGRTESHGCFRLANWNATHLVRIVRLGMPVYVEN